MHPLCLFLLRMQGAISKGSNAQYLDKLQVERDRGITVKVGGGKGLGLGRERVFGMGCCG